MKNIADRIARHSFFANLEPAHLKVLAEGADEQIFEPGAMILKPGAPAYSVYLIEDGKITVEAHEGASADVLVQMLGPGEVLGWSWLFPPFTWHLQARATERTRTIRLDGGHLLAQCEADHQLGSEVMKRIAQVVISRLQAARKQLLANPAAPQFTAGAPQQDLSQDLREHPFLKGMSPAHLNLLSEFAMRVEFKPGELIFRTGDPANRFYLLQSGSVALQSFDVNSEVQRLEAGDVLGWSWLFDPYKWQFDARALERSSAIFLYGTRLREMCESNPDFGYELLKRCTRIVIDRLHVTALKLLRQAPPKAP